MPRLAPMLNLTAIATALFMTAGSAQAQQSSSGLGADISTNAPRPTLVRPISRCLAFTGITQAKCLASEKPAKPQPRNRVVTRR